jgi:hypothetical protein
MLAGVTRIIEIIAFAPAVALPVSVDVPAEADNNSDHTLADTPTHAFGTPSSAKVAASTAFRHLPPFVSIPAVESDYCH